MSITQTFSWSSDVGGNLTPFSLSHTHYDDEYLIILTRLNGYYERLVEYTAELVVITNDMKVDIQRLRERGETATLGICTDEVTSLNGLERAVVLDGIKKAGVLEDVRQEMRNPTPMPQ